MTPLPTEEWAPTAVDAWDADAPDEAKLPPRTRNDGRSARARIAQWMRYRLEEPGISNAEVARRIGIAPSTLNTIISRANREGWLRFSDPLSKLEHQLMPKIVRNLDEMLDNRNEKVTIEAAKGALFPLFKEQKGLTEQPNTVIAIKLELPPQDGPVVQGTIIGTPKTLALPIIDADPLHEKEP